MYIKMVNKYLLNKILIFIFFNIIALCCISQSGSSNSVLSLESSSATLLFDVRTGSYDVVDNLSEKKVIERAHFSVGMWKSNDSTSIFNGRKFAFSENGLTGQAVEVSAYVPDGTIVKWNVKSYKEEPYFVLSMSVENKSADTIILKKWGPLMNGKLHNGTKKLNAKMLDGNGGGEATRVHDAGYMRCRNNLLFTFEEQNKERHSLVIGGIRYADFEKHTLIETDRIRKNLIAERNNANGLSLISYIDLGEEMYDFDEFGTGLIVQRAWPYNFVSAKIKELGTTVYASKQIVIEAKKLDANKKYSLGFSWMDEGDARVQTVMADNGEGSKKYTLVSRRYLPQSTKNKNPEELLFKLPADVVAKGNCRILVEMERGPNAVLSEIWLNEGWPSEDAVQYEVFYEEPTVFFASMYAQDPVGKRIDPGTFYQPVNDLFYLDISTRDPFQSLENYGLILKRFQDIKNLSLYTFPTVCLWYASHPNYGGGPSINDSPGAVAEMDRADSVGFTKYSTVAIRLVPDNYEVNNEQGWWDEKHWQMYGSGSDNPNSVIVPGAHYKIPYLTTKQWAGAILKKGGIPLTYFQTARRSQDFADSFPHYMLFNQSDYSIPDSNWLTLGKSSYDFTDSGFINHMKNVYKHLHEGGIQGMMFDYTSTAWPDFGGMEDNYSTAAAMYRNVFKLAHEGLGKKAWIHERNLERGTDLTLGLVASQRVWGDTDGITDEMVSRTGLRWYKNRVVVSYDMDSKNTEKLRLKSRDYLRQMLTMSYVASGRLLLGNSFAKMNKSDVYDLSRIFPMHTTTKSARPIDAFVALWPTIYDFKVNDQWHLLTLYNTNNTSTMKFDVSLSLPNYLSGLQLNAGKQYYFYDYWNEDFIGKINGNDTLKQELRGAEARMMAVHEVAKHPQFISTNRHIMQGYIELQNVTWQEGLKKYTGNASVIGNEPFKIIVALNSYLPKSCKSSAGKISWKYVDKINGIVEFIISTKENKNVLWEIQF